MSYEHKTIRPQADCLHFSDLQWKFLLGVGDRLACPAVKTPAAPNIEHVIQRDAQGCIPYGGE